MAKPHYRPERALYVEWALLKLMQSYESLDIVRRS